MIYHFNKINMSQLQPTVLRLFETVKTDRENFVSQLVEQIEEGKADPLKVHLQLKAMEDVIDRLTNITDKNKNKLQALRYRELLLSEAEKNGKNFELHNAKFDIREVGTKYDYSKCGDPIYQELEAMKADVDARIKERQKFLQSLPVSGMVITIEQTGETIQVYPPSKTSTTSVAVTLQ